MERLSSIGQLEWLRNKILARKAGDKPQVHVCMTGCRAYGASQVKEAIEDEVKKHEQQLYDCGCAVEADEKLNQEMKLWDVTLTDGIYKTDQ